MITDDVYFTILNDLLLETFPGAEFEPLCDLGSQRNIVSRCKGGTWLGLKTPSEKKKFFIRRSQIFNRAEVRFITKIANNLISIGELPQSKLVKFKKLIPSFAVADTVTENIEHSEAITGIIQFLEACSSETYEGGQISLAIVFNPDDPSPFGIKFSEYSVHDFAKVISNGYDTYLEVNVKGELSKLGSCAGLTDNYKCPFRYSGICALTKANNKIGFVLNRNGEILIFKDDELLFSKRRDAWKIFNHDTMVSKIAFGSKKFDQDLRRKVYATALDVSFARSGGCLAYVYKSKQRQLVIGDQKTPGRIRQGDLISSPISPIGKFCKVLLPQNFKSCERSIRKDISAIDGSMIIDDSGHFIACGAIVAIESGSEEGGRSAAAKCLSHYGVTLKISQDGIISVYKAGDKKFIFA
jgi:hypothetical protein